MTRTPALAMAVLTALTLAACGTEHTNPTDAVGVRPAGAPSAAEDPQPAFMEMVNTVARPCAPEVPSGDDGPVAPGEKPRTGPAQALPTGDGAPALPTAGPEVELNAVEWCAGHLHVERVTQALMGVADPTPDKVRRVLNGLGYVDERIHGLKRSGATTRFSIDLRVMGGALGLKGTAAGTYTDVEFFAAPETGPFEPGAAGR
ncbi:hypothetical protein ACFV3E_27955 [Streptomyces sp. NPDC059718]